MPERLVLVVKQVTGYRRERRMALTDIEVLREPLGDREGSLNAGHERGHFPAVGVLGLVKAANFHLLSGHQAFDVTRRPELADGKTLFRSCGHDRDFV